MATEFDSQPRTRKSPVFAGLIVIVIVLVLLGAFTLLQRRSQYQALAKETEALAVPTVAVIHPTTEPPDEGLVLPGSMQAYVESPIYARTNGYLRKWYRDIGSRVRQGELLADIDTPEVDQQVDQARADLNTASPSRKSTTPKVTLPPSKPTSHRLKLTFADSKTSSPSNTSMRLSAESSPAAMWTPAR